MPSDINMNRVDGPSAAPHAPPYICKCGNEHEIYGLCIECAPVFDPVSSFTSTRTIRFSDVQWTDTPGWTIVSG